VSSQNVELVRSICADWERGDYSSAEWAHRDIEFIRADGPEAGTWRGFAGLAEGTRYRLSAWEGFRVVPDALRELDKDHVLVLGRLSGRGKMSGLELEQMQANAAVLFEVRHGEVTRLVVYMNRDRAFADLGLAGEADSPRS
jgi:ketosteroid isomerase-like protein